MQRFTLDVPGLETLIAALLADGYEVLGPVARSGSIDFDSITSTADLPAGLTIDMSPGRSALRKRSDVAYFGYVVGQFGLKPLLFPPRRTLWEASRKDGSWRFTTVEAPSRRVAVIGARPCDLAAAAVHDRVFLDSPYPDFDYAARREDLFLVTVNCTEPAPTCFCASLDTGPRAHTGFDLAITEILADDFHVFVGEVGSGAGARLLTQVPHRQPTHDEIERVRASMVTAMTAMQRKLDPTGVHDLLEENLDHPRWQAVADRCLACGNCTQVCPTCFCVSTEDDIGLDGAGARRERRWDTCFSLGFSFMGGRSVRVSTASRYRQWLTHKLAGWVDQFGTFGCVGCGRCIVWCPVGIDLTQEVAALTAEVTSA